MVNNVEAPDVGQGVCARVCMRVRVYGACPIAAARTQALLHESLLN